MTKRVAAFDRRDRERVLWVNVIMQAIRDATETKNSYRREADRLEARAWFDASDPSFCEVCFLAGFDPERVCKQAAAAIERFDAGEECAL